MARVAGAAAMQTILEGMQISLGGKSCPDGLRSWGKRWSEVLRRRRMKVQPHTGAFARTGLPGLAEVASRIHSLCLLCGALVELGKSAQPARGPPRRCAQNLQTCALFSQPPASR